MIALALDAITSYSVVPLRLVTLAGFVIFVVSMLVTLWALWGRFFTDRSVPGWASTVLPMYFLGGIQIFCLGVLGEYLGKIYAEVKSRPRFFVEKTVSEATIARDVIERPQVPATSRVYLIKENSIPLCHRYRARDEIHVVSICEREFRGKKQQGG